MTQRRVYKATKTQVGGRAKANPFRKLGPTVKVHLYAIQCAEFVKIGIAIDAKQRMRELALGNPFSLAIVTARGIRHEISHLAEHRAHQKLAHCYHRGEWFRCQPNEAAEAVASAISETNAAHPVCLDAQEQAIREHARALLERSGPLLQLRNEIKGKWHSPSEDALNLLEELVK